MVHYKQMPLGILQIMIEREIISIEKTHDVHLLYISVDDDGEYQQGDGHWCESFNVDVEVNGESVGYKLEWDMEEKEITTIMKENDHE